MTEPETKIHRVSMWLCDGCLDGGGKKGEPVPGCALCLMRVYSKMTFRTCFPVEIHGFRWEGCPACRVADSGGWAKKHDVDASKCKPCRGTGLVRVRADDGLNASWGRTVLRAFGRDDVE